MQLTGWPQAWIDVNRMTDLEDAAARFRQRHGRKMRVATKYVHLTRRFFAQHGISDYRIVESLGATEGAPASGSAELIVDITTTGATLTANALKVIDDGVMLRSEANLVASIVAPWQERQRRAVASILRRIAAEEEARTHRDVRADLSPLSDAHLHDLYERFEARPVGGVADHGVVLQCPVRQVFALTDHLLVLGAERIAVSQSDYIFRPANPLLDMLEARIGTA